MFMIYSPQTMQLLGASPPDSPDPPEVHGTVHFDHEGEDTSKCRMTITSNDRVWTYTFNTRGLLVDSAYEDDATRKAKEEAEKKAAADLKAQQEKEQAAAKESADHELKTSADTTAADVSWDAPASAKPGEPVSFGVTHAEAAQKLNTPEPENVHG